MNKNCNNTKINNKFNNKKKQNNLISQINSKLLMKIKKKHLRISSYKPYMKKKEKLMNLLFKITIIINKILIFKMDRRIEI